MSSISTGSVGAMGISGAQAAAKRAQTEGATAKADSAAQKFKVDEVAREEKAGGIADADMDQDRDADGRQLYHAPRSKNADGEADEDNSQIAPLPANPDAFGITGTIINVDA